MISLTASVQHSTAQHSTAQHSTDLQVGWAGNDMTLRSSNASIKGGLLSHSNSVTILPMHLLHIMHGTSSLEYESASRVCVTMGLSAWQLQDAEALSFCLTSLVGDCFIEPHFMNSCLYYWVRVRLMRTGDQHTSGQISSHCFLKQSASSTDT